MKRESRGKLEVMKKEEEEKKEEIGVAGMVEKKWNNSWRVWETVWEVAGSSSADRAIEPAGNGSVVPVTLSTAVVRIWKISNQG